MSHGPVPFLMKCAEGAALSQKEKGRASSADKTKRQGWKPSVETVSADSIYDSPPGRLINLVEWNRLQYTKHMSRPAHNIYKFLSPTDGQLLKFLADVFALEEIGNITFNLSPGNSYSFDGDLTKAHAALFQKGKGRQILRVSISGKPLAPNRNAPSYGFDRGETIGTALSPSNIYGEILFHGPEHNPEGSAKVAELIQKHFKMRLEKDMVPSEAGAGIFVTQLAEISTGIAENLANAQIEVEKKAQERLEQLDAQSEALRKSIEEERQKNQVEFDKKSKALDKREADLNNARARSERRGLRQSINKALKSSLETDISPKSAKFAKWPIIVVSIIGLVFSLVFALISFDQVRELIVQLGSVNTVTGDAVVEETAPIEVDNVAINWLFASLIIRGSLGLIAATFFGLYLIRYFQNIEETANRRALELERYLFDIDRASWVIETVMELKEDEGISEVPEPWLKGTTHNLFGSVSTDDQDTPSSLEALGEILASGASLKLGNGSGELDLKPKAAKKISKG